MVRQWRYGARATPPPDLSSGRILVDVKERFSEEQIIGFLREAERGVE